MTDTPALLFVCLGNICRSPLAEADSAGTGDWHVGEPPDRRAQATARRHGIDISGYRGRQVSARDFHRFTHILALDHANLDDLRALRPRDATARLSLLLDHVPGQEGEAVADPYWGNETGFDTTWAEVSAAAEALVAKLQARS